MRYDMSESKSIEINFRNNADKDFYAVNVFLVSVQELQPGSYKRCFIYFYVQYTESSRGLNVNPNYRLIFKIELKSCLIDMIYI